VRQLVPVVKEITSGENMKCYNFGCIRTLNKLAFTDKVTANTCMLANSKHIKKLFGRMKN